MEINKQVKLMKKIINKNLIEKYKTS